MWLKIKAISSGIWEYIQPIVVMLLSTVGKQLMVAALAAVANAAKQPNMNNQQKFDFATNEIKNALGTAGVAATESAINLAIEMAVRSIKDKPL